MGTGAEDMSTTQQPEALTADHSEQTLEMVARWYMIDKDGMATLCTDREDAEKEAKKANMAWPHTAPHRAVQLVEASFDSADMATAAAQGFRDGVASVAAGAGSEPVAWRAQFDAWWARNRVSTHHVKHIGGFAAKVWHAAIQTVVGATDSTAGFYPADEGSNPSRQATNSSPPEGMVGGWMPIETAPVGRSMFVVRAFNVQVTDKSFDYTSDAYGVWQPTPGKFERWPHPFAPTHWMPLPLPPTTSAGSGKGG